MQKYVHEKDRTGETRLVDPEAGRRAKPGHLFDDLKQDAPNLDQQAPTNTESIRRLGSEIKGRPDSTHAYVSDLSTLSGASFVGDYRRDEQNDIVPYARSTTSVRRIGHRNMHSPDRHGAHSNNPDVQHMDPQDMQENMGYTQSDRGTGNFASKYIQGDSFPATTSGQLSSRDEDSVHEGLQADSWNMQNIYRPQAQPQQRHHKGSLLAHAVAEEVHTQSRPRETDELQQALVTAGKSSEPTDLKKAQKAVADLSNLTRISQGFQFSPHNRTVNIRPQPSSDHQALRKQIAFTDAAPRHLQYPVAQFHNSRDGQVSGQPSPVQPGTRYRHDGRSAGKKRAAYDIQSIYDEATAVSAFSKIGVKNTTVPSVDGQPKQGFNPPPMQVGIDDTEATGLFRANSDIDVADAELFAMDYATVKAQASDRSNIATSRVQDSAEGDNASIDKFRAKLTLPLEEQLEFFDSLSKEEWENAGDWFIEQFATLVRKLKDVRQDQRIIAKQFEHEVDQRHAVITRARENTEDALSEMKESGAKVLQTTPKTIRAISHADGGGP